MSDDEPATSPAPTAQDRQNAAIRAAIAERQQREYDDAKGLAYKALGPGWTPWMKLSLIDSEHHRTGNTMPVATVFKVYRGEEWLSEQSAYIRQMSDGQVLTADSYEPLFGELLHEPHPTRQFEIKGQMVAAARWTLVWSSIERYEPRSAEDLARLRTSRERGKAERKAERWAEENPLLAFAKRQKAEDERER
jgi:hypothetical protein